MKQTAQKAARSAVTVSIQFDTQATPESVAMALRELAKQIEQDGLRHAAPIRGRDDGNGEVIGAVMMRVYERG